MSRVKISGNLICYNEIRNIKRCIENFLLFVDELLIIDGGSTDGTIDIINSFDDSRIKLTILPQNTDRINTWDQNYDINGIKAQKWNQPYRRNLLIDSSSFDWILVKDADEDIGEELLSFYKESDFSDLGYKFLFFHLFKNNNDLVYRTDGPWNPQSNKIRLFRKKAIRFNDAFLHPSLIYHDSKKEAWPDMIYIDVPVWHYHYIDYQVGSKNFKSVRDLKFNLPMYIRDILKGDN